MYVPFYGYICSSHLPQYWIIFALMCFLIYYLSFLSPFFLIFVPLCHVIPQKRTLPDKYRTCISFGGRVGRDCVSMVCNGIIFYRRGGSGIFSYILVYASVRCTVYRKQCCAGESAVVVISYKMTLRMTCPKRTFPLLLNISWRGCLLPYQRPNKNDPGTKKPPNTVVMII